jgi:Ca2+-binding RTX toxin-like protein
MTRLHSSLRRGRLAIAVAATAASLVCALAISSANADVSHVGWPHSITVWFASNSGQVGVGTDANDMLLGGGGSDTIYGGPGADVIWGDQHPSPNGPDQTDNLYGGAGNDWIYASHGTNHIHAGSGDDHVFAYFGHGTIDCGPGNDILTLSKSDEHAYTVTNCETVQIGFP